MSNGRRGWQEIRLSLVLGGCWVQLGTWSSFLQLLGTRSQGMLARVSLAFLGPALLTLKSLGPTRPHSGLTVGTFYPIMKGIWNEMTLVPGNAGPTGGCPEVCLVGSPPSFPELLRLSPHPPSHPRTFCLEPGKFQQSLGCLVRACSGSHLYPILIHVARPGPALMRLKPSWEFPNPAGKTQLQ